MPLPAHCRTECAYPSAETRRTPSRRVGHPPRLATVTRPPPRRGSLLSRQPGAGGGQTTPSTTALPDPAARRQANLLRSRTVITRPFLAVPAAHCRPRHAARVGAPGAHRAGGPMIAAPPPIERDARAVRPPFEVRDDRWEHLHATDTDAWRVAVRLDRVPAMPRAAGRRRGVRLRVQADRVAGRARRPDGRRVRAPAARGLRRCSAGTAPAVRCDRPDDRPRRRLSSAHALPREILVVVVVSRCEEPRCGMRHGGNDQWWLRCASVRAGDEVKRQPVA